MGIRYCQHWPDHPDLSGLIIENREDSNSDHAVLILHGFTGTPASVASLVEDLYEAGLSVFTPALPGHAEITPAALCDVTFSDWLDFVRQLYAQLRSQYKFVSVVGLSLGAVLANLLLGEAVPPDRSIFLAIPYALPDRSAEWLLPVIMLLPGSKRLVWDKGEPSISDATARATPLSYSWTPLSSVNELRKGFKQLRRHPISTTTPKLFIHSNSDTTASIEGARIIADRSGPATQFVELTKSYHVLTRDVEKEAIARLVTAFICSPADPLPLKDDWNAS